MKSGRRWFDSNVYASFINGVSSSGLRGRGSVPCISHDFSSIHSFFVCLFVRSFDHGVVCLELGLVYILLILGFYSVIDGVILFFK